MTPPTSARPPAVSVVTPCFDPGPYLRPLLNGWADHRWRRLDIRAHGVLRGGAVDRLGWIGLAAVATAVTVGAADAAVLLGEAAPLSPE